MTGTLCKDVCILMTVSHWLLFGMRNVSSKSCRENQNTHFMLSKFFLKIVLFMR